MPGYAVTSAASGGEVVTFFDPRDKRTGRRGVVLGHGAQNPRQYLDAATMISSVKLAAAIANAGIPCITGSLGGDNLANDNALTNFETAVTTLQARSGCATDKTLFVGVSMGAANSIRYAQAHPTLVAGIFGICPAVDPSDIYVNNRGGLGSLVGNAWGGITTPTPLPDRGNLSLPANEALIAGQFPAQWYYSTSDAIILPATVTEFATATGTTAHSIGAAIHGEPCVAATPITDVLTFLIANGA